MSDTMLDTASETPIDTTDADAAPATLREAQLRWNDAAMTTTFANAINIQSTREQVDLFFGTNQTWSPGQADTLSIDLSNRVIMSPFAAKRLSVALIGVLREYESRYGALDIGQ